MQEQRSVTRKAVEQERVPARIILPHPHGRVRQPGELDRAARAIPFTLGPVARRIDAELRDASLVQVKSNGRLLVPAAPPNAVERPRQRVLVGHRHDLVVFGLQEQPVEHEPVGDGERPWRPIGAQAPG